MIDPSNLLATPFGTMAATLLIATVAGIAGVLLKQPLIMAFIVVGIVIGPAGLGWLHAGEETIKLLAEFGIAVLLFVVGLKLDVAVVRETGAVAFFAGLGQVFFTAVIGFLLCLALGMNAVPALYVAVALTFSSTIIIVKLLSDKREIDSLHGRMAIGFLIVQDLVVILLMIGLSALTGTSTNALETVGLIGLKAGAILGLAGLAMRFVLPQATRMAARSPELLVLTAISWAVVLAALGDLFGLSKEVGAFLAGVTLASTQYRDAISTRLTSLRDFLLLFFFLDLGMSLDMRNIGTQLGASVVLSVFVLVGNPLIVIVIMGLMGFRRRTSFLAGLTMAQISEFSLILAALGIRLGHIDEQTLSTITLVGLVTIGTSTYLIMYSHQLYTVFSTWLRVFERRSRHPEDDNAMGPMRQADVVLFGLGRYGSGIGEALQAGGLAVRGVDFDPRAVNEMRQRGFDAHYGDAEDPEFKALLGLQGARCVVSTMPDVRANLELLRHVRAEGYTGPVALAARTPGDAQLLRETGVLVFTPFEDAARVAAAAIAESLVRPAHAAQDPEG